MMRLRWPSRTGLALVMAAIAVVLLISGGGCCLFAPMMLARRPPVDQFPSYDGISPERYVLNNGIVHALVSPSTGRVLQFGYEQGASVFWENRDLNAELRTANVPEWSKGEWLNLGGDKAWPSPEGEWGQLTGRKGWRPPPAFDGLSHEARIEGRDLVTTSPVDPFYGIRVIRRIHLYRGRARMSIRTTFEKVTGEPVKAGVWVVTQLQQPLALFAPRPKKSGFDQGHTLLSKATPPGLKVENGFVSLGRDPKAAYKIGLDGDSLLWVGEKFMLRIDSPRVSGAEYPDKGSSPEIYTNPDPLQYIELETLGPLRLMKPGDKIERTNIYTLLERSHATPEEEARAISRR